MFHLCLQPPEHSGLNLNWDAAMELPIRIRDGLCSLLDEQRTKESSAYKKAVSR